MNSVKFYIRHCRERTVPIIEWFFKDYPVVVIDGFGQTFSHLLYENYMRILSQKEEFAIVADGDIIPILESEKLIKKMLIPFKSDDVITAVGPRVEKFNFYSLLGMGGFKAYRKSNIKLYLDNFEWDDVKTQYRPESYLFRKVGGAYSLPMDSPDCGHDFGQYLWHVYDKAFLRGVKSYEEKIVFKKIKDDVESQVYEEALKEGLKLGLGSEIAPGYQISAYNKNNLPEQFRKYELNPIENVEEEYSKIREEIFYYYAIQKKSFSKKELILNKLKRKVQKILKG